jgi:two-component system cell cycle sensor histidine kinase/response regulator CckA
VPWISSSLRSPPNELRAKVSVFANLFARGPGVWLRGRKRCRASVDQLRLLTDAAPIGIFQTDADRKYVYANPLWAELTGIPADQAIGRTCHAILDSVVDGAITALPVDLAARSERSYRYEVEIPGAAPRIVLATAKAILNGEGGTAGWVGTLSDVTAATREHETDLARREAEQRYRHIVETTMEGIWLIDADNRTTFVNEAMARIVGVTLPEFMELTIWDLLDPATHEIAAEGLEGRRTGKSERFETKLVHSDGTLIPVLVSVNPIFDENGTFGGSLSMVRDVTERVQQEERRQGLEEQLRHSQRLESIGHLAGGIAHDFNNLLLVICGYGELALRGIERGEQVKASDIKDMLEAGERATQLTRQLLAFGRRQVLLPEVVDLCDVLGHIEPLLGQLIGDGVELVASAPDEPVLVEVDRTQLEQVIANLAANARDAMPNGGRLGIELSLSGGENEEVVLSVSDNGCGMDPQTATRVFEPFFSTKGAAGTGFGLSTVHGIISQSGGRIALESRLGEGTTFSIYLPLSESAATPIPSALEDAEGGAETILVVEDDPSVRSIVIAMLEDLGYRILEADGGDEAVELASAHGSEIDLVLTDLVMPGSSGRETAERVRSLFPAAKVLYMSGYTDDIVIRDGGHFEPGIAFIQKPFGAKDLARSVREALEVELV